MTWKRFKRLVRLKTKRLMTRSFLLCTRTFRCYVCKHYKHFWKMWKCNPHNSTYAENLCKGCFSITSHYQGPEFWCMRCGDIFLYWQMVQMGGKQWMCVNCHSGAEGLVKERI